MDDLLADFVAETREMLQAIEGELVAWEGDPGDSGRLDAIFRFVHTVKGNCGFFDFPRLEKLSHVAESALAEVRAGRRTPDTALVTGILAVIDRITDMIEAIEAGEDFPEGSEDTLIAAIDTCAKDDNIETVEDEHEIRTRQAHPSKGPRSIRLPVALLDQVMSGVSDIVLARNEMARRLKESGSQPTLDGPFERLSTMLESLREGVTRMRMQRIEHLFDALPRLVRDLSAELGKQVMIDVDGGDVELDREMIEMIRDPLTHIIRNAVDHGIEPPVERLAAGKREIAMLRIGARQSGNRILVTVSDDGRGIDADKVAAKAVADGVIAATDLDALSTEQKRALIFTPGLSTSADVTAVSGRGVGMDVVRANIERIGGTIELASTLGEGTRFILSLPLTLSIVPALTLAVASQRFAVPRSYIEEILHGASRSIEHVQLGDSWVVDIRGIRVPCIALSEALGIGRRGPPDQSRIVLVRLARGNLAALAVDQVLDHEELVVKPLASAMMALKSYSGSALLDDGTPILMLDVAAVANRAGIADKLADVAHAQAGRDNHSAGSRQGEPVLTFTAIDGRLRAIRLSAVERIMRVERNAIDLGAAFPQVVLDRQLLPLAGTGNGELPDGHMPVLRLTDGDTRIAYAVREILDKSLVSGDIVPAPGMPSLEGTVLLGDRPVEIVDAHRLFAEHTARCQLLAHPACGLDLEDGWTRSFLKPLVEAAGYRTVDVREAGSDDIAIVTDASTIATGKAKHVIPVLTDPEMASITDGAVYRYDRAGIVAALAAAARGSA